MRCKNSIGWSERCEPLMAYSTKEAVAPGKPLYLDAGAPTANSFQLRWSPPLRDGGAEIVDYLIHYVEVRHLTHNEWVAEFKKDDTKGAGRAMASQSKTKGGNTTDEKHEVKTVVNLRVGGPQCEFKLRDLRGETDYVNIEVRAKNKAGQEGDAEKIDKVTTLPPSMRELLIKELKRAEAVEGDFVDTDFYQGFLQREYKRDYVARLKADLAEAYQMEKDIAVRDEASEELAKRRWAASKSIVGSARMFAMVDEPPEELSEEAQMEKAVPEYKRKRTQFEHRLKQLEKQIEKAEADQLKCFADRAALTRAMADQQERVLEVRAEIDRVAGVKAPYINSSVIHGSVQRFTKPQLQRDLQIEMEKCLGEIADSKRKVQILDKNRIRAQKTADQKKTELHDRQAQFVNVRADVRRQTRVTRLQSRKPRLTPKERAERRIALMQKYVELWQDFRADRRHARGVALRVFVACARRYLIAAVHRLRYGVFLVFEVDAAKVAGRIVGKGGRLLKLSAERREENIADARAALRELSELRGAADQLAYSRKQLKTWQEGNRRAYETSELHAPVGGETVVVIPPEETGLDPVKEDDLEEDEAPPEVAFVLEGDGFRRMGRTDEALACYERAIRALFDRARLRAHGQVDVAGLARAQVRIGNAHFDAGDHTKALTALDRAGDLVRELAGGLDAAQSIDRKAGTDDAALVLLERLDPKKARFVCLRLRGQVEMGLGQALVEIAEYDQGQTALEKARETYAVLGDVRMRAEVSRALAECARRQHLREDVIASHEAAASEVDEEVALRLKEGAGKLLRMKERLFSTSAKQGKVTPLKRQSARALRLVNEQQAYKDRIVQCKEERGEQEKTTAKVEQLRERIDAQLKEAKTSDKDEMSSTLVHGREQIFEIEELKVRLTERLAEVTKEVEASFAEERAIDARIANYLDDIVVAQQEYDVEAGALMLSVLQKSKLRFIAFNPANAAGNEVLGSASGGVAMCVAAEGKSVSVFNLRTGVLRRVFTGDEEGRHLGAPVGHTSLVSALHFSGERVYTGGMDCRIFVWDVSEGSLARVIKANDDALRKEELTEEQQRGMDGKPVMCLEGHEATVTAVAVDSLKIVSGGADTKMMLWARATGERLRVLHGHSRSVVCLNVGPTWVASGGQESEARIWSLPKEADPSASVGHERSRVKAEEALKRGQVRCRKRLSAGGAGLTAVKYGSLELIAGLADGHIIVWWLQTGDILQRSKAHDGPVFDLQFDATRVVSAGGDALVVVTDVTTGEQIQSLRGHDGPVIQLQFDTSKILSAGVDNTLRQWTWATDADKGKPSDKYHVYDAGDTLVQIARKYNVSIPDIVRWNAIEDVRKLYAGTRLIVAPGNPDEPTEPERAAAKRAEQKKRRNAEVADAAQQRGGAAKKDDEVLAKIAEREKREKGEDKPFEPRKTLRDLQYVDKASISSRFAASMEPTALDLDAIRLRKEASDAATAAKRNALGTRIREAIENSIDPFGDVAAARQKRVDEENLARERSEREEALAQAPQGGQGSPSKRAAAPKTRAEKEALANAAFVFESVLLPTLLAEECYQLAEAGLQKMTWNESLAGRLCETIEDGPMDYDALELLLAQERMKAARLHAAEVRKNLEHAALADRSGAAGGGGIGAALGGIGGIAMAASSGSVKKDDTPKKDDDDYSVPDSQQDISTVVSSHYSDFPDGGSDDGGADG